MRLKNSLKALLALVIFLVSLLFFQAFQVSKLREIDGKRTFYLYENSSCALQTERLSFAHSFKVRGESVCFDLEREEKERVLKEIIDRYQAVVVFYEKTGDIESYYAYAPSLGQGVCVEGKLINLHIVFGKTQAVVGTPIVFGGF